MENRRSYERCLALARSYFSEATRVRRYSPEQGLGYMMDELEPEALQERLESALVLLAIVKTAISHGVRLTYEDQFFEDLRNLIHALPQDVEGLVRLGVSARELQEVAADVKQVRAHAGFDGLA